VRRHETLLVVDATTGQNGVQAGASVRPDAVGRDRPFALTKLDGSAKGGVAIAIANELGLPRQADRRSARVSRT